jgi:hypothetical protein
MRCASTRGSARATSIAAARSSAARIVLDTVAAVDEHDRRTWLVGVGQVDVDPAYPLTLLLGNVEEKGSQVLRLFIHQRVLVRRHSVFR